jgi:outer membrane protein OmpA-like peptidoglycan-associated protein
LQAGVATIITVKPNANGFVATLPESFFVPNLTTLHVRAKSKMDALASVLSAHPDAQFLIEGHSDARANAESFSLSRAQAVADYLAALGVARGSFRVESRGATVPVSTKKTPAARAMNRRVELVFAGPQ